MNLVESVVSQMSGSGLNKQVNEITKLSKREQELWDAIDAESEGDPEVALVNVDYDMSMADWNKLEKGLTKKGYIKTYKMSGKIWIELLKD